VGDGRREGFGSEPSRRKSRLKGVAAAQKKAGEGVRAV
jgi:hypothetical protein